MNRVHKTTIYLPLELKEALRRTARYRGCSESQVIREGVALVTANGNPPRPRLPLFASGKPGMAERVDDLLEGFGET